MADRVQHLFDDWLAAVLRRPWIAILATILVVALAGVGALRLQPSADYRDYFDEDAPRIVALDRLETEFTVRDTVLMVVRPREGSAFTNETIGALRTLDEALISIDGVERTISILNMVDLSWQDGRLRFRGFLPYGDDLDAETLAGLQERATTDPALARWLVSVDGRALGVFVHVRLIAPRAEDARRLVSELQEVGAAFDADHPEIDTALTGTIVINDGFRAAAERDLATLLPFVAVLLFVLVLIFLRSLTGTSAVMLLTLFSAAVAVGLAGWFRVPIMSSTAAIPVIVMAIALADSLHVLTGLFDRLRDGMDRRAAIRASLHDNFWPIVLTSLTTAIGLFSLNFSDTPPFRALGTYAGAGVLVAMVLSLFFLPALIALVPLRPPRRAGLRGDLFVAVVRACARRPLRIVLLGALATGLSVAVMPRLYLGDVFYKYLDRDSPIYQASHFAMDNLPALCRIRWTITRSPDRLPAAEDPAFLRQLAVAADRIQQHPGSAGVQFLPLAILRIGGHRGPPPGEDAAIWRQAPAMLAAIEERPGGREDVRHFLSADGRSLHLAVFAREAESGFMKDLEAETERILRDALPGVRISPGTGPCLLFAHMAWQTTRTMIAGTAAAFVVISLLLVFVLRSVGLGLISLLPNIVPPVIAFGIWAAVVGQIGVAASIIAATAFGMIVDATIHLLVRYRRHRAAGDGATAEHIARAAAESGPAIVMSMIVLIAGFLVLLLSEFGVTREFGALTTVTLAIAIIVDFTMLPALIALRERWRRRLN